MCLMGGIMFAMHYCLFDILVSIYCLLQLYVLKSEMDTLKTNFVAMTSSLDRTKLHMHEEMEKISNEHSNHIIQLNEQLTLASELNNKLQNDLTEVIIH